jgi:bis(5'-nucleosyl)-tetraphosphatase (symmetrical)
MSTYAIGDVQGCFDELLALLKHIQFDVNKDTLWFTGDLVNRGPRSLDVLRFVKSLGDKHVAVLGNHDLHLLALAWGVRKPHAGDTLADVLTAPDREALLTWLCHRPLLHYDKHAGFVMTHAGLAPEWSLQQAGALAREVEAVLRSPNLVDFLKNMYGDQPDHWDDALSGVARWRCITNYFTRLRFCYADGRLNLSYKGEIAGKPDDLIPWFLLPNRVNAKVKILFGHWAALGGKTNAPHLYALDTGCVWGRCLTALRLEDEKRFSIQCG